MTDPACALCITELRAVDRYTVCGVPITKDLSKGGIYQGDDRHLVDREVCRLVFYRSRGDSVEVLRVMSATRDVTPGVPA
jgi:hypothetical protein